MQHVLKRALGLDQHLVMDYLDGELQEGESYLLLSDGVWSYVPERDIAHILHDQPDLDAAARALVNLAHQSGSQDNASALLLRVEALPEAVLADALAQLDHWPLPPKLRAGQLFEGWQVNALLHESRQSLIYRVLDGQGQPWLLKTLPPSRQDEADAGPALLQEEWFMRRVAGRNFAALHPLPERQHLYYVQREYSGTTLARRFERDGPLPLADLLQVASRLIRAVGMLHRRNILHRDIKPENLLLGEDGELRILDFGLAFCPGLSRDLPNHLPGTPSFIAPEAFTGAEPSAAQDLYATGVTLYYLLTGHYPYGEIEAFQHPRFGNPPPASRYRPDVPNWLEESLGRAVALDPRQRFETAEQWLLELEQGEQRSASLRPRPLLEREPLKVWRGMALLSLLLNLLLIVLLMKGA